MTAKYKVRDLVIDDEFDTITSDSSVKDAARIMKEKGIPDLVVLENNSVLGVIADFDIVIGAVASGKNAESTKVTESMYRIEPVTVDSPVEVAFNRMQELEVSAIPVVDDKNKLIGVVTITDCWGYLPEKYEDYKGLLTVSDPKSANYWFTLLMATLYFIFGILSPILGLSGFIKSTLAVNPSLNPNVTYFLFDARGTEYFVRFFDITGNQLIWALITIIGVVFVIVGVLATFMVIQWAYGDYHMIKQSGRDWHMIAYYAAVLNIVIMWLLWFVLMNTGLVRAGETSIDFLGILFSSIALICITLAIGRDVFFKQSTTTISSPEDN